MHELNISATKLYPAKLFRNPEILDDALAICNALQKVGHQAFFVGGCVRDALLKRRIKDIDIATNAKPEEIKNLFDHVEFVGAAFGVSLVKMKSDAFELATFRKDGIYTDSRRPDSITYGSREEDSHRRDFQINALYYDPHTGQVLDDHGGLELLRNFRLATVGDPQKRFSEDALRILRAVRFATRLNFVIEENTLNAMRKLAPGVLNISPERIRDELTKILTGPFPSRGIRMLEQIGLLDLLLPEVTAINGVIQGKRFHPEGEVLRHTLLALECEMLGTAQSRWAILLHDIGKKPTFERREGKITFYQHDHVGADMSLDLMKRLKFSNDDRQHISEVVRRHMRFADAKKWNCSTMRRFISTKTIESDLSIHRADCEACHGMLHAWELVRSEYESGDNLMRKLPDPLVTGNDLIDAGLTPSPLFSKVLNEMMDAQLNQEIKTEEEALAYALSRAQEYSSS